MDASETVGKSIMDRLTAIPFDMSMRVAPIYLLSFAVVAFFLWHREGRPKQFIAWLLPKSVYFHPSHILDIKVFVFSQALALLGFISRAFFPAAVAVFVVALLCTLTGAVYEPGPITAWEMVAATLIVALTLDFCAYWIHRLHHETTWLWPFHALHHSAEVLTPITLHRRHPVYDLLSIALRSVVIGVVLGVALFAFLGSLDVYTIGGANVVYVVFRAIGANFNHTHIWFSYGRVLEHILVSPAQHQIHHSRAIEHHDKNYGEIFAFWDWMFGTLYVPERREALEFGLADADGRPIEQPYTTLRDAMLRPFAQSWEALRESLGRASRAGIRRRPATRPGAAEPQSGEQLIRYPSRVAAE